MNDWFTLLPPVIAIILAVVTRQVYVALFAGILCAGTLIQGNILTGFTSSFDGIAQTFQSTSSVKSLIFILSIGALMNVLQKSGGVMAVISLLSDKRKIIKTKTGAQLVTYLMGFLMCLESVGSMMMVGIIGRPLFARFDISREKLAFIANSTGAPIAWLLPVSAAGVFLASLISVQIDDGVLNGQAMDYVFSAVPYQFYTILILASVPLLALKKHDFHHKEVEKFSLSEEALKSIPNQAKISFLVVPLTILLGSIISITLITGNGNILKGDISSAIYWSGFIAILGSGVYLLTQGVKLQQYVEWCLKGMQTLLPAVIILVMAFTLSHFVGELGTGKFLASLVSSHLPFWLLPAAIFLIAMLVAFTTGSSGATVSILIPLAIPMAVHLDASVPMIIGAVISGAVFGDQSSLISDSVIVASTAADCRPE